MPIPSKTLNPNLGDIAAEAAIAFQQSCFDARPRRCQRGGKAARAGANDKDIRLADYINFASGFEDSIHHLWATSQFGAT
jgi:hypothetical protein